MSSEKTISYFVAANETIGKKSNDINHTHYKTTLLSTVGKSKYNENRHKNDFKNAAPILVM